MCMQPAKRRKRPAIRSVPPAKLRSAAERTVCHTASVSHPGRRNSAAREDKSGAPRLITRPETVGSGVHRFNFDGHCDLGALADRGGR
jgi:hypothetical protein